MTFGPTHYVPILKAKRGEKHALELITQRTRKHITPLLEIVERKPDKAPTVDGHLTTAFKGFDKAVKLFPMYFLDCREIAADGHTAAADVFARAHAIGTPFTPVTGISRSADLKAALKHGGAGIAIRVTRDEFEQGSLSKDLTDFVTKHGLRTGGVDLLLDLGPVDKMVQDGIERLSEAFLSDVPMPTKWRTLSISACSFPLSMRDVDSASFDLIDRAEWLAWRNGLHSRRTEVARLPTFSDCAIQHPFGVEGFDFTKMQVSASVRYALPDQWLLIKGVSTKKVPAKEQFPKLAMQLAYGHHSKYFAKSGHCAGCQGIFEAANGKARLGSPEAWRRLGTIHHLTRAVEGLSALTWP